MIEAHIAKYFEPGFEVWRDDGTGMDPWSWETDEPNIVFVAEVEGRLRPLDLASTKVQMVADRMTVFADYKFYCFLADIREGDQIRHEGRIYEVQATPDMMSMGRLMQISLKRVE